MVKRTRGSFDPSLRRDWRVFFERIANIISLVTLLLCAEYDTYVGIMIGMGNFHFF